MLIRSKSYLKKRKHCLGKHYYRWMHNFQFFGKSIKSKLYSVSDCQAITKKAIVNRLSEYYHRYGRLHETGALYQLEVALLKDKVTITLDTTG